MRIIFSVNSHIAIQNLNIDQPRHLRLCNSPALNRIETLSFQS